MKKIFSFFLILALSFFHLVSCNYDSPQVKNYDSVNIAREELKGIKRLRHESVIKLGVEQYDRFFAEESPIELILEYSSYKTPTTFYLFRSYSGKFSCRVKIFSYSKQKDDILDIIISDEIFNFYYKYALSPELIFGSDVEVDAIFCFAGYELGEHVDSSGVLQSSFFPIPSELNIYFVTNKGDYVFSRFRSAEYLIPASEYKQFAIRSYDDRENALYFDGGPRQILSYADDLTRYAFEELK